MGELQGFNLVILATAGLKHSAVAPVRGGLHPDGTPRGARELLDFPWTEDDGFVKFLQWYKDNYLEDGTDVIVMLPERDIRYLLKPNTVAGGSILDATQNFQELIRRVLDLFGDRLAAWYIIDEPELFERQDYLTVPNLVFLNQLIQITEKSWRETPGNDDDFLTLSDTQKSLAMLPGIVTFSARLFALRLQAIQNDPGFNLSGLRDLAAVFMYDEYPYKRVNWRLEPSPYNLREELIAGTSLTVSQIDEAINNSVFSTLFQNVSGYHENFDLLRREINFKPGRQGIYGIASPEFRYAIQWVQGNGSPFDHSGTIASSATTPAPNPGFTENFLFQGQTRRRVSALRGRRLPEADELRFFTWIALFSRSEGMPVFSQYGVSNQRLLERFWPVAQEVDYFSDLRIFHDLTSWAASCTFATTPAQPQSSVNALVVGYTNPPSGNAQEVWLFAYNRLPNTPVQIRFEFLPSLGLPASIPHIFRPYRFGVVDPAYPDLLAFNLNAAGSITIPGERIAMFKWEPFEP